MPVTNQYLIMSSQCLGTIPITKHATRSIITPNVMSANTLFQQMQLGLLNTEHIHFGPRSIVLFMSMMEHPVAVAVSEWSHGIQDILPLMMVESSVSSAWTLR